ncbi:hypothetical protein J3L16_03360 [Alteromonas sp. 5E99-2]|uniref:hypothetical protein n=1 Tax=Alteromonas sp. 5E99-2 TaxID=2817683 RepID=UPI001A999836|nr:hypothetical protein [Alteromonas sp. 5E99-2]MBO1254723.1 hypothetical protein [Alteromonas sp. 5E99-2]
MNTKLILARLFLLCGIVSGPTLAVPVTIDFSNLGGQNGASAISLDDLAPDAGALSLGIDADTFNLVSFAPFGPFSTFSLNNDRTSVIDTNQFFGDEGLGARDFNDGDDDIDGFGDNDILLFSFSREVTLLSVGFDNILGNADDFIGFAANEVFGSGVNFLAALIDVPNIEGDDGLFVLGNGGIDASFFGFGALENNDSFRITSLTIDVATLGGGNPDDVNPPSVAVSAPSSTLLIGLGLILTGFVVRRKS